MTSFSLFCTFICLPYLANDDFSFFCRWKHVCEFFCELKGLATLIASVKLQRSCQVGVLPDTRKFSKADQIMGANGYSSWRCLGAIRLPLWLKNCHNMAIFPHFLAFSVTLLVVRTTVMLTLGIQRTQTLVTHMGLWCGAIFALSRHPSRAGGGQTWLIF